MRDCTCGGVKNGVPNVHPLKCDEMRALRRLKGEAENCEYVRLRAAAKPKRGSHNLQTAHRRTLKKIGIKGCSICGLRKNAADALAEAECTDREIMAVISHGTAVMVTKYTHQADQNRRGKAAVEKWENTDKVVNRRTNGC